jgi:spore coat polysaccharide biosynthesis protein SpsF
MSRKDKKLNIVAIIQARMGSTRLSGKVLLHIEGRPLLEWVILRVKRSRLVAQVVVATSRRRNDDPIAVFCRKAGIICFRGSERNVLERFWQTAQKVKADIIVRITADCPLIDPHIIDKVLAVHLNKKNEYTANNTESSYPRGTDVEVFNRVVLDMAHEHALSRYQKEHVTPFMYENIKAFKSDIIHAPKEFNRTRMRLCVDEVDDLVLIRKICAHFSPRIYFTAREIMRFLRAHPEIAAINKDVKQKRE